MPKLADRVLETTTTAGTGTLTLAGAVTGYRSFNTAFTNGDVVFYSIDNGQGEWEVGYGSVGTGSLTRSTVLDSSNGGSLVVFSAGLKQVWCDAPTLALLPDQTGNSGKILATDGTTPSWTTQYTGTVTAVSVTTANGLAGTSSGGATPALTLSTTVTGIVKGNGTSLSAAVSGTDYAPATSGTSILKGNGAGGFSSAVSGTDYAPPTSGTAILKGNGTGGFNSAISNTDYLAASGPIVTGTLQLNGATSGYVGFQAATAAGSTTYTLPSADGTSGQALVTNGTATLSWGSAGISTGKAIAMAMIFGG